VSLDGIRIESERLLERLQRIGIVFLIAIDDPQQVVTLYAGGIIFKLLLDFLLRLIQPALAQQFLCFKKSRRGFGRGAIIIGCDFSMRGLMRCSPLRLAR